MKEVENAGDAVEIFEEDTVITLYDEEKNPIEFFEIASIEYDGKFYELLQPVKPIDGIGEDEAVIFEYEIEEGSDEKTFKPVFDEELLNEVFSTYLRAVSDCDCDDCGHGHCGCGCEDGDCGDEDCCDDEKCDCGHKHHDHK